MLWCLYLVYTMCSDPKHPPIFSVVTQLYLCHSTLSLPASLTLYPIALSAASSQTILPETKCYLSISELSVRNPLVESTIFSRINLSRLTLRSCGRGWEESQNKKGSKFQMNLLYVASIPGSHSSNEGPAGMVGPWGHLPGGWCLDVCSWVPNSHWLRLGVLPGRWQFSGTSSVSLEWPIPTKYRVVGKGNCLLLRHPGS